MNRKTSKFDFDLSYYLVPKLKDRLWVQSDNTVKELRNQYGSRSLASLVQCGVFSSACMAHLRVGHTHEDIDGLFSLVTSGLASTQASNLQTPRDLQRVIDQKLSPVFHRKGLDWGIEIVDTVSQEVCFVTFFYCPLKFGHLFGLVGHPLMTLIFDL